ncbi:hypothetical protein L7F22_025396 [Adiantum nelumboides]|nr:hypothetical protein [Adiantum nelumboides]
MWMQSQIVGYLEREDDELQREVGRQANDQHFQCYFLTGCSHVVQITDQLKSPLGSSVAIAKTPLLQQRAFSSADTYTLPFVTLKSFHGVIDRTSSTTTSSNNNHACRLAGLAFAATAWMGLSMWPLEALAMVYQSGDNWKVSDSVISSSKIAEPLEKSSSELLVDSQSIVTSEMETLVGNVPSIQPPNEGLNSPWVPKIKGLKNGNEGKRRMVIKRPPWTMSELEMVLPDLQGKPKPFPRTQGQVPPFWPATNIVDHREADDIDDSKQERDQLVPSQAASSTLAHGLQEIHDSNSNQSPPPPQQDEVPKKKARSCFTL